jgi:hypothetical protein
MCTLFGRFFHVVYNKESKGKMPVRLVVLRAGIMKITVFWDVTSRSMGHTLRRNLMPPPSI